MKTKFDLTVESKLENLPKISQFIDQTMQELNIQQTKTIHAIQLSIAEACTNIIQHAYQNKSTEKILIQCKLSKTKDQFEVHITDWGKPFNPTAIPKPDTQSKINQRKEGGLGIFLMKQYMDKIKYASNQNKNKLVMTKKLTVE